ncbi:unnamed protein product, partial [Polarella glacialis]
AFAKRRIAAECTQAVLLNHACGVQDASEAFTSEAPAMNAVAGVRCCYPVHHGEGKLHRQCVAFYVQRNISWSSELELMGCMPQMATYYDAYRICTALGMRLCFPSDALECCGQGCSAQNQIWTRSPEAESCLDKVFSSYTLPPPFDTSSTSSEPDADRSWAEADPAVLRQREELFLSIHEEARSTVIQWLPDAIPPGRSR